MRKLFLFILIALTIWSCQNSQSPVEIENSTILNKKPVKINSNPTILLAELSLYVTPASNTPRTINVHMLSADWNELEVTWEERKENETWIVPGGDFSDLSIPAPTYTVTEINAYAPSVDVTNIVKAWVEGANNFGVLLELATTGSVQYSSREGSFSPILKITWSNGVVEDLTPIADAYIWELYPELNTGDSPFLYTRLIGTNTKRALIKFELPTLPQCETAYGFYNDVKSNCFTNDGFGNWGWTNGDFGEGEYSFNLYAGAGQCDIDRGSFVGTVEVDYKEGKAEVSYNIFDGFIMNEVHFYIGSDPYPTKKGKYTVAPGQYTYKTESPDASNPFYIDGLSGNVYIIAHAVVCGDFK